MPSELAIQTPHGIRFQNGDGEMGVLSGKTTPYTPSLVNSHWVQRTHPMRDLWIRDELKQRASFLGTRQHLTPFLVPHRFEGRTDPTKLSRAKLAYGVGLNSAYLQEIFGHIRSTPAHYTWGSFGGAGDQDTLNPPEEGSVAEDFWYDVTGDGVSWTNFFEGKVLEWLLTAPGSLILVDSNRPMGPRPTRLEATLQGFRSTLKHIPFSWVEDYGRGHRGYRWIKLGETLDVREPQMASGETGFEKRHVIYELTEGGQTRIRRYNDKGDQVGGEVFQTIRDTNGRGILPFIEVKFGSHPDIDHLGTGLLMGLDDIVIDLFNLLTEIREAYRSSVFDFLAYKGPDMAGVQEQLENGTRLVHIGDDAHSELTRVGADSGEVTTGIALVEMGLKNWALGAKRRAMEAVDAANARSGVSLKAEFQLDLVPLMVSITETLDEIETNAMFILAQMEGMTVEEAKKLVVKREKEFQMEQEASRIARIVGEFLQAIPGMPAALLKQMILRWTESIDFLDLDQMIEMADGTKKPLREVIEQQADEIAEADQQARIRQNEFGLLGMAAIGEKMGGNANGGGDPNAPPNKKPGAKPPKPEEDDEGTQT